MQSKLLAILAAAAAAQAAVVPEASQTLGDDDVLPTGFVSAIGGALDLPQPTAAPEPVGDDKAFARVMTVTYANHDSTDIRVAHRIPDGSPKPLGNWKKDAHIGKGKQEVFHYPPGLHAAAFVNSAGLQMTGNDETVIEFSFQNQNQNHPVGDIDVSYVNGFSRAASCVCRQNQITTGCSKNLWALHHCPADNHKGSCKNPKRFDNGATSPPEFFSPCNFHGGAFTFPKADANNLNQRCPGEDYWCCIGTSEECARLNHNPRQ